MATNGLFIFVAAVVPDLVSVPRTSIEIPTGAYAGVGAPGAGLLLLSAMTILFGIWVGRWWLSSRKEHTSRSLMAPPPQPRSVPVIEDATNHYTNAFSSTLSLAEITACVAALQEFEWSFDDHKPRDAKLMGIKRRGAAERIEISSLDHELFSLQFSSRVANPAAASTYFEVRELIHDVLNARLVVSSVEEEIRATHDGQRDTLNLNGQGITELPANVGVLRIHLKTLYVGDNLLTRLPSEIGELTRLTDLDVSMNCLIEVPESIRALRELEVLGLTHNNLEYLPTAIGSLDMLRTLAVDDNRLRMLPPQLGKLSRLSALFVQNNLLTKLPTELAQLTHLKTLHLPNNGEKTGHARRTLKVTGNPLVEPPAEVVRNGTDAIKEYLRTRGGSTDQHETGDPNHGTTFFASFMKITDSVDQIMEMKLRNAFPELAWQHARHEATGRRCWGTTPEVPQHLVVSLGRMHDNDPFRLVIGVRASEQAGLQDAYRSLLDRLARALTANSVAHTTMSWRFDTDLNFGTIAALLKSATRFDFTEGDSQRHGDYLGGRLSEHCVLRIYKVETRFIANVSVSADGPEAKTILASTRQEFLSTLLPAIQARDVSETDTLE